MEQPDFVERWTIFAIFYRFRNMRKNVQQFTKIGPFLRKEKNVWHLTADQNDSSNENALRISQTFQTVAKIEPSEKHSRKLIFSFLILKQKRILDEN